MSVIRGSWGDIRLFCGNGNPHPSRRVEMELRQGPHSLFYACPCYHEEDRQEGEYPCFNRINLVDFEKMLTAINNLIVNGDAMGEVVNLTNYRWKNRKGMEFLITRHDGDEIDVEMVNRPALKTVY